jgi:hypothetical protein
MMATVDLPANGYLLIWSVTLHLGTGAFHPQELGIEIVLLGIVENYCQQLPAISQA